MIQYDPVFWKGLNSLEQKFDLIYVHDLPGYMFPAQKLKKLKRKHNAKIITEFHEYIPDAAIPSLKSGKLKTIMNRFLFEKPMVKISDKIIVVSKFGKQKTLEYGYKREDIFILPNYAHEKLEINKPKERENAVAFVGRLIRENGPENIKSFINKYLPDEWKFYFIGSDLENLTKNGFSEEFIKKHRIIPLGMLPYNLMLQKTSIVMFTLSHMDPKVTNAIYSLPNKFYDSLAAGTPVLCIDKLKEQKEIIEKKGVGIIFNLDFSEKGIQEFQKQILDEEKYKQTLENIKTHQDEFLWQTHENEYIEFIKSILKKED